MSDFAILSRVRIRRNHRCQTAKATTVADDTLQNQQSMPHALISAQYNRQLQERQSYDPGFRNS